MTYRALMIAGWVAMISAFASIPVAYLSWKLEGRIDSTATFIQTAIQIIAILIFLAITLNLKKLLNVNFKFHDTDKSINWMIKANVVAGILTVIALQSSQLKDTLGIAALLIIVVQGLVQIQFGYTLLKLQNNLGGMLKPFCYASMAIGICVASVILILVGVLISAISDLMLGTIFFNIAKLVKEQQYIKSSDK